VESFAQQARQCRFVEAHVQETIDLEHGGVGCVQWCLPDVRAHRVACRRVLLVPVLVKVPTKELEERREIAVSSGDGGLDVDGAMHDDPPSSWCAAAAWSDTR